MLNLEGASGVWPDFWSALFASEARKPYLSELMEFVSRERQSGIPVYPEESRVFQAIEDVATQPVRVVILGQDPYHGAGQAMGRSFAVPNSLTPKPPSLINIFKELESDLGIQVDRSLSDLSGWAAQGVLLLNTILTVRESQPLSHAGRGWEQLTDRVLEALAHEATPKVFVLWGAEARSKKALIASGPAARSHLVIESPHPSPLSAHRGFLGSRPFSKTNAFLKAPIDWTRLSGP